MIRVSIFQRKDMTMQSNLHLLTSVTTEQAAKALNRTPQTLRKWACLDNGPIRPIRINGRLAWRVSDLQALLGGDNKVTIPNTEN